jgi:signal transduction histidine kinase
MNAQPDPVDIQPLRRRFSRKYPQAVGGRRAWRAIQAVSMVNRAINLDRPRDEALALIAAWARRITEAAGVVLMTVETGGAFLIRATAGTELAPLRGTYVPFEETSAEAVVRRGRVVMTDTSRLSSTRRRHDAALAAAGLSSVTSVPIPGYGQASAVMQLGYRYRRRVALEDLRILEVLAAVAGIGPDTAMGKDTLLRLARRLHDSVVQPLYGIVLLARSASELVALDQDRAVRLLDRVQSVASTGLADVHDLIFEVRHETVAELRNGMVTSEGLAPALNGLIGTMRSAHGLVVEARVEREPELAPAAKQALYLIAQEALVNVVGHARARHVSLRLSVTDSVVLEVGDDGVGFDPQDAIPSGLGLRAMRERAEAVQARLEVVSAPGAGTLIRVTA